MLEVRDDNAAAFEELVLRYQDRLMTILRHLAGDAGQAEDLAQEIFLRVYRSRKTYEPSAKFATWFFTIANNVVSNSLRSRSRRHEHTVASRDSGPQDVLLAASSGQMPARLLDKAEMREIVRMALESIPERQRLAVLLCKFEGLSYADIAAALEATPQAVKSLLARARINLREILQPYYESGELPGKNASVNDE
ncbi:MAG: sigma-70 family RNA polymerase sigma factor [Pirellulales bacterium]|nr:sigma-70 family RNA polymerase sigma factor [Pirellulales bacterium]